MIGQFGAQGPFDQRLLQLLEQAIGPVKSSGFS
jgi:hypothetical protein